MKHITFKKWQDFLDMPRKTYQWHVDDIADEYAELEEATGPINRWSEYSDITYAVVRGRWDGFDIEPPISKWKFAYGSVYMIPKYSLRFMFYRRAGKKLGASRPMTEVRNPRKVHKLHHIAGKYDVDPDEFTDFCKNQLRYWPLLK